MMVGMMTPSAAPMFLMYDRVGRQTKASGSPLAATAWFAAGYFLVWIVFSLFATLVHWALERSALLDFTMTSTSSILAFLERVTSMGRLISRLAGIVLIVVGAWLFSIGMS